MQHIEIHFIILRGDGLVMYNLIGCMIKGYFYSLWGKELVVNSL